MKHLHRLHRWLIRAWTLICISIITPVAAFAADNPDITTGLTDVTNTTVADKIIKIATGVGAIAGAVAVCMLIYAGIKLTTAPNEKGQAEAKGMMVNVLMGLGVVGLAVMLVGFVAYLIKV